MPTWPAQCLQRGLVDEILVYVLPVLLGDGVRFSTPGLGRIDLEPFSNTAVGRRHDAPLPRAEVGAALQQLVRCP